MSRISKYQCDRCKLEDSDTSNLPSGWQRIVVRAHHHEQVKDLCAGCKKLLGDFLDGKAVKRV